MDALARYPHLAVIGVGERTQDGDTTLVLRSTCPDCKTPTDLTVPFAELQHWLQGAIIQRAMPSVPADQRELLITGTCDSCWDRIFDAREGR